MKRRDNAILLGIGTTRRKFLPTDTSTAGLSVRIPARRYRAKESGKLCRGHGNHKCLFNKADTLCVLCPETVLEDDDLATVLVHREWNGKDMLMQRNFSDYKDSLDFEEECALGFPVVQAGRLTYGGCDEFLCIHPVQGTNLWVDKRLILSCEATGTGEPGESEKGGECVAEVGEVNAQRDNVKNEEDNTGLDMCGYEDAGYCCGMSDGFMYDFDLFGENELF